MKTQAPNDSEAMVTLAPIEPMQKQLQQIERETMDATPAKTRPAPALRPETPEEIPAPSAPDASWRSKGKLSRVAAARIELPIEPYEQKVNESDDITASSLDEPEKMPESVMAMASLEMPKELVDEQINSGMPANWPNPQGFIPRQPTAEPPKMMVQSEPIISHMRTYNGSDEDFTHALGEYYYFRDDARFGGWQSYLQRSEDFIRFCCHQHIVETLESRGGSLESRMILRWPVNRYER